MTAPLVFRRVFPFVVLALIAVVASLQARGLTQLLSLELREPPPTSQAEGQRAPLLNEPSKSGRVVLERNPFDSQTGSLLSNKVAAQPTGGPKDPLAWPACEGVQVVVVTESRDPWWSITSVRAPGEPQARLRRVGDTVGGWQVAFIGFNPRQQTPSIWLSGASGSCQSALFRSSAPLPKPDEPAPQHLARAALEQTLRDPLTSLRSVRVVPEQLNGTIVGLRLFNVRPGSLLGSIGIQNGDRVESVNGLSIAAPEQALQAYAQLRSQRHLAVHLVRAGAPLDLALNID